MDTIICSKSRRVFLKGVAVGARCVCLGCFVDPSIYGAGQSTVGSLEKIPMEVRWKAASSASVTNSVNLSKYRYDVEGREKYNEGAKIRTQGAGAWMKGFANSLGLTGNDAKSMAVMMPAVLTLFNGPQQKYEIEEATAEKARVKCINCAHWNAMQQMKITDDLCSTGSQYMWDGFAKAVNPKMTSTLVKARPRGDSVCEWVIELKA